MMGTVRASGYKFPLLKVIMYGTVCVFVGLVWFGAMFDAIHMMINIRRP